MTANTTRLDRFIRQHTAFAMSDARLLLAQGRIMVDGLCLQADSPLYIALNKPKGGGEHNEG